MTPPSENGGLTRRNLFIGTAAAIGSGILTACGGVTDRTAELQAAVDLRTMSGMHGISSGTSTASLDVRGLTTDATAGFFQPAVASSVDGLSTVLSVAHTPVTIGTQVVQAVTYEQSYPGPTLEIRPGDTLRVQLVNDTDENTNLHTHGLHVSPSGNSDNVLLDHRARPAVRLRVRHPGRPSRLAPSGTTRTCTDCRTSRCSAACSACSSCAANSTSCPASPAFRSG